VEIEEFKAMQRQVWEMGDYPPVGRLIEPGAQMLVERGGVHGGQRVLDVGSGSGSVAVAAAKTGAEVVGIDITDAWFAEAHRRAEAADVAIDLRIGDAEEIPFEDESFDVVLSSFAAIFAPRHDLVTAELVRVCRPGGLIGLTAWTPEGKNNVVFSTLGERLPPGPEFAAPGILWGDPDHVRSLFAPHDVTLQFDHLTFPAGFESAAALETFAFENSGPLMRARSALEEMGRWEEARAALQEALAQTNEADDGSYRTTWEFLLILATRAG
jgi:SAM-dependent methyltransferase